MPDLVLVVSLSNSSIYSMRWKAIWTALGCQIFKKKFFVLTGQSCSHAHVHYHRSCRSRGETHGRHMASRAVSSKYLFAIRFIHRMVLSGHILLLDRE